MTVDMMNKSLSKLNMRNTDLQLSLPVRSEIMKEIRKLVVQRMRDKEILQTFFFYSSVIEFDNPTIFSFERNTKLFLPNEILFNLIV